MSKPVHLLLRTQSDARLTRLTAEGSTAAFEAIVDRYRAPLTRACARLLPAAIVDDAVQQTFINAWAAITAGAEVRELRPWLYQVARNSGFKLVRQAGSAEGLPDDMRAPDGAEDVVERRMRLRATLDAVAALPARQREALVATAIDGRSGHDVARGLGLNEPAVRQLVSRARCTLRQAAAAVVPFPLLRSLAARASVDAADAAAAPLLAGVTGLAVKAVVVAALAAGGAATVPTLVGRQAAPASAATDVAMQASLRAVSAGLRHDDRLHGGHDVLADPRAFALAARRTSTASGTSAGADSSQTAAAGDPSAADAAAQSTDGTSPGDATPSADEAAAQSTDQAQPADAASTDSGGGASANDPTPADDPTATDPSPAEDAPPADEPPPDAP